MQSAIGYSDRFRSGMLVVLVGIAMMALLMAGQAGTSACDSMSSGSWFHREYCGTTVARVNPILPEARELPALVQASAASSEKRPDRSF